MKKVSILSITSITLVLLTLFIQAQPINKEKPKSGITVSYNPDNSIKRVDAVFTNELTLDSLMDIKKALSEVNISIDYRFMEFDENGYLIGIACNMNDGKDGSKGYFKTPDIKSEVVSGFYYDYSENAEESFCCGSCWKN